MPTEETELHAHGDSYRARLDVPDDDATSGIAILPGAGHGPYGDVFDRFAAAAADAGHLVARARTWTSQAELREKSDEALYAETDALVDLLGSRDCETVAVVAKSFGGRIALEHVPRPVDRMVLWAPAILFGEDPDKPTVDADELGGIDRPVRILQGDRDEVVDVENARSIAAHLPEGELVVLEGEDHSFRNDEEVVVEFTLDFIDG